jgi:hypothetical protein
MLRPVVAGAIGALIILGAVVCAAFFALQKECSSPHQLSEYSKPNRPNDNAKDTRGRNESPAPEGNEAKPTAIFKLRVTRPNEIDGSYYAENREEEKEDWSRKFWCDTKIGEFVIAIFTVALAVFTGGLWWSTYRLWEAGERQLTGTQRPWVKVDKIEPASDLVFEDGEGRIDLIVIVSNKGNSPGLRVRVNAKIVVSNRINLLQEQATFSRAFRSEPTQHELRPELTSWPNGDTIVFPVRAWLNSIDMARFKSLADNTPFPIALLSIVGCVDYEFSFSSGHHQTGLIYNLRKETPYPSVSNGIEGAVRLEGIISKSDLSISIPIHGTGPVD